MDMQTWQTMTPAQRKDYQAANTGSLTPQLVGLEGYRVEVIDNEGDAPRRFQVGKSTGWAQCHLELYNAASHGGDLARKAYHAVRIVRRIRS